MIDEKKKETLDKVWRDKSNLYLYHLFALWLQISGCSDKPKDKRPTQERAKPTLSTDPDRRNQLAGWQSIRAGWRYIETHSDAEDTNPRFIPSFTEYPDSEDNSCTAGNLSRDRNDDPTIRSDGRLWRLMTNPLVKGRHSDDRYRWLQLAFINGS